MLIMRDAVVIEPAEILARSLCQVNAGLRTPPPGPVHAASAEADVATTVGQAHLQVRECVHDSAEHQRAERCRTFMFEFGHTLFGTTTFAVLHFVFAFPGFQTYNVLINPNNLIVQAVLRTMLDDGDYFFFALHPQGQVTAFRAAIGSDSLAVLRANRARLQASTTTDAHYQQALTSFAAHPEPAGILLPWVCRETVAALDLTTDRLPLTPA